MNKDKNTKNNVSGFGNDFDPTPWDNGDIRAFQEKLDGSDRKLVDYLWDEFSKNIAIKNEICAMTLNDKSLSDSEKIAKLTKQITNLSETLRKYHSVFGTNREIKENNLPAILALRKQDDNNWEFEFLIEDEIHDYGILIQAAADVNHYAYSDYSDFIYDEAGYIVNEYLEDFCFKEILEAKEPLINENKDLIILVNEGEGLMTNGQAMEIYNTKNPNKLAEEILNQKENQEERR